MIYMNLHFWFLTELLLHYNEKHNVLPVYFYKNRLIFLDKEKEKNIYKILTKEWMQSSTLQRGYVHPRCRLSTKLITSKEDWQKIALSQKKRVLTIISLIRCRDVSFSSKTLLFLSIQRVQKIACGINKIPFSFVFLRKAPSQAKR